MPNPMTVKGAESLREELAYRKGILRQEIAEAIAERAHGDLKENAEYHAAREQQVSMGSCARDRRLDWRTRRLSM